ncbi:MAG: hypothetical protein IPJ76_07940 [Flavobacteriales bacterium]|nr:MAG: hypothetical protein IPJ76_07940 [Flavobacteriales bacterium]
MRNTVAVIPSVVMIAVGLLPGRSLGQTLMWGPEEQVGPGGSDYLRPRVHATADGKAVVLWGDDATHTVRMGVKDGANWILSELSGEVEGHPYVLDWTGPESAADANGAWAVYGAGMMAEGPIYLHRTSGGIPGATDTLRIDPPVGHEYKMPSVASMDNGEAVILVMRTVIGWSEAEYVLLRTTGGGTAVLPEVPVSLPVALGEACDCCTGTVVANGNTVVALFRNNFNDLRTVWAAVSYNGGASFLDGAEVDPTGWTIAACPSSGPDAYFATDSVHCVFMSAEVNGTKSYGRSFDPATLAAGTLVELHPGQPMNKSQNYPRIAGAGDTLGVAWQQGQVGQFEILFRWSVSGWGGMSDPDTVNLALATSQKNPDVAFRDGVFHLVWQDAATNSVHYRSAQVVDDVGLADGAQQPALRIYPTLVSDRISVVGAEPGTPFRIVDQHGAVVYFGRLATSAIGIEHLRTGVYSFVTEPVLGTPRAARFIKTP